MSYYRNRPRRATLAEWTAANPTLLLGEMAIVTPDTGTGTGKVKVKFGDGVTPFNTLPYGYNEEELNIGDLDILKTNTKSSAVDAINENYDNIKLYSKETTGSGVLYNSGLVVSAQSTPNMSVSVSSGTAYMPNGARIITTANTALAITSADTTNPRIDIVYVNSSGVISYLAGIAALSPTAPSLPSDGILLAEIRVEANTTTIVPDSIIDKRTIIKSNTDIVDAINEVNGNIGDKSNLNTTNKSNLVNAINENITNINNKVDEIKASSLYSTAVSESFLIPEGALKASIRAINEDKTLKVVAWGDSITEQADLINGNIDGYISRFEKDLKISFTPFGIIPTVLNYAMGGRGIGHAVSDTFIGGTSDTATEFYRTWSTVGKTWKQSVKDTLPDLLIIAFGMNDSGSNDSDKIFYDNLVALTTYIKTWTKVPDIVLVPTILPTTNTVYYTQSNDITNAVARSTREYAKTQGFIIADANRLFRLLRDGVDECKKYSQTEFNFENYPNGWGNDTSDFTLSGTTLTPTVGSTGKFVSRERNFLDGVISVEAKPVENTDTGIFRIYYRSKDIGGFLLQVRPSATGDGYIQLYKDDVLLQYADGLNIPAGSFTRIDIAVYGTSHKIYISGNLLIDINTYYCLHEGYVSFGSVALSPGLTPTFQNVKITYYDNITTQPIYTELELLGNYNDPLHDGNGVNHPTGLGHTIVYRNCLNGLFNKLISYMDSKIKFSVNRNAVNQSITQGDNIITFTTKLFDVGGCFDITNNYFKPTSEGYYYLHCSANLSESVDAQEFIMNINKNGSPYKWGAGSRASGIGELGAEVSGIVYANGTTDYFKIALYQEGGNKEIKGDVDKTYFEGFKI